MNTELLKELKAESRELEFAIVRINSKIRLVNKHGSHFPNKAALLNNLKSQRKSLTEQMCNVRHQIRQCSSAKHI